MKPRRPPQAFVAPAEPTEEERELFRAAMLGVEPLGGPRRVPVPPQPSRIVKAPAPLLTRPQGVSLMGDAHVLEVEWLGEVVVGRARDVNLKLVKQLKQGEPAPQASLDLHGKTAAVAKDMLARFVVSSAAAGRTSVLVVHGRGHHSAADGPVIKSVVVNTLASRLLCDQVLAFATAPRALGAEGALMVRLRRAR